MPIASFEPSMVFVILPQILLLILSGLVLIFDAIWKEEWKRWLGWLTAGGLVLILVTSLAFSRPGDEPQLVFGGMLNHDWFGFAFTLLILFGAAISCLFIMDMGEAGRRGEFYMLLLISVIGMTLMASAADMVMLYLAIETTSIPLYILAGFIIHDQKSTESGFKYLLFGALTSTVMLYGLSLLYGFSGTTNLYQLPLALTESQVPLVAIVGVLLLILIGFGFKISIVPLHFWAPDVYEGAPTPVAGFLSTVSKAAGFAILVRVLMVVFTPAATLQWTAVLAIISVITMTVGNAIALAQRNIKRLLAYSSIAHAGYILIGIVALNELGLASTLFYLAIYLVTNLAAFGIVVTFWRAVGSDDISAYAGLSRRAPGLALALMVAFLSLAGMPPFGGFVAKVFIFAAAVQADYVWLAILGVINSIVGLYYYLIVLKYVYLYRGPEDEEKKPLLISRPYAIALTILTVGVVLLGTFFGPWFQLATKITSGMF